MFLNKTFQYQDMAMVESSGISAQMRHLVDEMTQRNLMTTSHALLYKSNLSDRSGWYRFTVYYGRMWEYVRLIHVLSLKPGDRVLDCGGASSPVVFYLAALGCRVDCLDLSGELVDNTRKVAKALGWPLQVYVGDMTTVPFADQTFDYVISVSVIEHLRPENKARAMQEMTRVLKPSGILGLTFDFGAAPARMSPDASGEVHIPLKTRRDVQLLIEASQCEIHGNAFWVSDPLEYPAYPRPRFRDLLGAVFGNRLNTVIPRSRWFRAWMCTPLDRTLATLFLRVPA